MPEDKTVVRLKCNVRFSSYIKPFSIKTHLQELSELPNIGNQNITVDDLCAFITEEVDIEKPNKTNE